MRELRTRHLPGPLEEQPMPKFHTGVSGRRVLNPPTVPFRAKIPYEGLKGAPIISWFTGLSRSWIYGVVMILPQVHLRKPCYDFTFL